MKFDLSQPSGRRMLADQMVADIDEHCRVKYNDGPRTHLGASLLAHPCEMYLWLVYRWAHEEKFDGRMQRLFNRGHREEQRWFEWLRDTGWTATDVDPTTGKQIRISFAEGHGGGSLDAEASHPVYTDNEIMLGEFKTYNDKQFTKLKRDGLQKAKPQHWGQKCTYGFARKIRYGFYAAICKNDDQIIIEVHQLDWSLGEHLMRRGTEVILSKTPPPRLSDNQAWQDCKWCGKYLVCHGGEPLDVNCRSCRHAEPHRNGEWFCTLHNGTIPADFIPKGCKDHFPIMGPQRAT